MNPQVLKEYSGPAPQGAQDVLFLLRPQANNYFFESMLLSVVRSSKEYKHKIWLEYLANMPGEKIKQDGIMEKHYEYRVFFAQSGKKAMSDDMKRKFSNAFSVPAEQCDIIGSYEALDRLQMTAKDLFECKVDKNDQVSISGQSIKRFFDKDNRPVFVINSDIPALLQFNHVGTNSAVLVFRTTFTYQEFNRLVLDILDKISTEVFSSESMSYQGCRKYLSQEDIENLKGNDFYRHKRIFHFSHGPFEQILDMRDFLYHSDGSKINLEDITYARFLMDKGLSKKNIENMLHNPIVRVKTVHSIHEESLFTYTRNMNYEQAFAVLGSIVSQRITSVTSHEFLVDQE